MNLLMLRQELDKSFALKWRLESQLDIDPSTNRYRKEQDPQLWSEYQYALNRYNNAREALKDALLESSVLMVNPLVQAKDTADSYS